MVSSLFMKCTIIGASLEGLTCAYLLRKAGIAVSIVEKASSQEITERGIRLPPNDARLLQKLPGVARLLKTDAMKVSGLEYLDGSSSRSLGVTEFFEGIMKDLGSNFYVCKASSLLRHIHQLCHIEGIEILYNTEVTSLSTSMTGKPILRTKNGTEIESDLIIGADGDHGVSRSFVPSTPFVPDSSSSVDLGYDSDDSDWNLHRSGVPHVLGLSCLIPVPSMRTNDEFKRILESPTIKLWMEGDLVGIGMPLSPDLYAIAAITTSYADIQELLKQTPLLCDLIKLSSSKILKRQTINSTAPALVDPNRKVVLLGNAGVSVPFYSMYADCIAIEGAFTIASLLSCAKSVSEIPHLLRGFQVIRTPRNHATILAQLEAVMLMSLQPGPIREMRNHEISKQLKGDPEANGARIWGEAIKQFDYDAVEAVDSWWLDWGKFEAAGQGV